MLQPVNQAFFMNKKWQPETPTAHNFKNRYRNTEVRQKFTHKKNFSPHKKVAGSKNLDSDRFFCFLFAASKYVWTASFR